MKSRRPSSDPKVPIETRKMVRSKENHYATDRDKWLIPADTTTLEVALPNELVDKHGSCG